MGPEHSFEVEIMTGFVPVMWSVWGVLVVLLIAVNLYMSRLARDEEDQIFLGESFDHEKSAQAAIVDKVNKVEPIKRLAMWLLVAMTVFVVAYYIFDIFRQFR
jgi:hypothetical protein